MSKTEPDAGDEFGTDQDIPRDILSFQRNILIILADGPMYGLAIKRELEGYYDKPVNHGRLYPNLDTLVEMGLLEKSSLDKRSNQYSLSDDGHTAIADRLGWILDHAADGETADVIEAVLAEYD